MNKAQRNNSGWDIRLVRAYMCVKREEAKLVLYNGIGNPASLCQIHVFHF